MGRAIYIYFFSLLLIVILFSSAIRSERATVEPDLIEKLEENKDVPIVVELEKKPDDLSLLESLQATDVPLEPVTESYYRTDISYEEIYDLLRDPNVISVREDKIATLLLTDSVPLVNASVLHSKQINGVNLTGIGQTVCVIDSGANSSQPGISGKIVAEKCFCAVSDKGAGGCCSNNASEANDAEDDHGHGTHVAGIVAANGTSALGTAPGANLVIIKVTNSSSSGPALFSDITKAVNWCANNATLYNISVISMSLGGGGYTAACDADYSSLDAEITTAINNNISVVAATGNSGSTTQITAPACLSRIISVSATTKTDGIGSYSNRNNITDLFAPGDSIVSLSKNGGTETRSGTSMSAPHVSGIIALLQQYKQDFEGRNLTVSEINTTLATNGTMINDSSGSGRLFIRTDAYAALAAFDTIKPNLTNANTTASQYYIYNNVTFVVNATDVTLRTVWILGNWTGQTQNYTLNRETSDLYNYTISNASFSAGVFRWKIYANDSHGNIANTSFFNLTILSNTPQISLDTPANNSLWKNVTQYLNFTVIDDVSSSLNCTLYINNIVNTTQNVTNGTLSTFTVNFTEGTNLWHVGCRDSDNLFGNSTLRTIRIDLTPPIFQNESLANIVELGDNQSYSINITDLYNSYGNFSFNGENITMNNISTYFYYNFTATTNGTNNYSVYGIDGAGNLNRTTGNFTVNDSIPGPRMLRLSYISSLSNNSRQNISIFVLNALSISAVYINTNGSNFSMSNNSAYNFTYNFTTSGCGSATFKIFANDTTNNGVTNASSFTLTNCCGDGTCNNGESCSTCSTDCGACSTTSSGSSSGGGGGGGGSRATAKEESIAEEITEPPPESSTQEMAPEVPEASSGETQPSTSSTENGISDEKTISSLLKPILTLIQNNKKSIFIGFTAIILITFLFIGIFLRKIRQHD